MSTDLATHSRDICLIPNLLIASRMLTQTVADRGPRILSGMTGGHGDAVWAEGNAVAGYYTFRAATSQKSVPGVETRTEADGAWAVIKPHKSGVQGIELALLRFAEGVSAISEVVAVSHAVEGDINRVWTFTRQRDKRVRRQVYLEELNALQEFPRFRFDFNVVSLDDTPALGMLPDDLQGRIVLYRERQARPHLP